MTLSKKLRFSLFAVALPWTAALACGGRTGDISPNDHVSGVEDSGVGGSTGSGARGSSTSGRTAPSGSSPGTTVSPPSRQTGGTTSVVGPPPFGSGGFSSFGGAAGTGASSSFDCTAPACDCVDCTSNCICRNLLSPGLCEMTCAGAGGSTGIGGAIGFGGFAGSAGGPTYCSTPTTVEGCGAGTLPVNTCCTPEGHCGVQLVSDPAPPNLPFAGGCQAVNQPGYDTLACPDLGSLIGAAPSVNVTGCCRNDGTCGVDLGIIGVGCVQTVKGGRPLYCSSQDAGTGTVDASIPVRPVPIDAGND